MMGKRKLPDICGGNRVLHSLPSDVRGKINEFFDERDLAAVTSVSKTNRAETGRSVTIPIGILTQELSDSLYAKNDIHVRTLVFDVCMLRHVQYEPPISDLKANWCSLESVKTFKVYNSCPCGNSPRKRKREWEIPSSPSEFNQMWDSVWQHLWQAYNVRNLWVSYKGSPQDRYFAWDIELAVTLEELTQLRYCTFKERQPFRVSEALIRHTERHPLEYLEMTLDHSDIEKIIENHVNHEQKLLIPTSEHIVISVGNRGVRRNSPYENTFVFWSKLCENPYVRRIVLKMNISPGSMFKEEPTGKPHTPPPPNRELWIARKRIFWTGDIEDIWFMVRNIHRLVILDQLIDFAETYDVIKEIMEHCQRNESERPSIVEFVFYHSLLYGNSNDGELTEFIQYVTKILAGVDYFRITIHYDDSSIPTLTQSPISLKYITHMFNFEAVSESWGTKDIL